MSEKMRIGACAILENIFIILNSQYVRLNLYERTIINLMFQNIYLKNNKKHFKKQNLPFYLQAIIHSGF